MEKSVCVLIGGERRVLKGIKCTATAKEVINRLTAEHAKPTTSFVLLETWKGCSRVIGQNERIGQLLDQWGYGELESVHTLELAKKTGSKMYRQRRETSNCCKVAARKKALHRPLQPRSKKARRKGIMTVIKQLNRELKYLKELTTPTEPPQEQLSLSVDISSLPPELEDEFVALQEALTEEERDNSDLQRRRGELTGNVQSQRRELEALQQSTSALEAKVKNEEHKLSRLIETTGPPELEDAQKDVAKLQNDLNVRTKLNKLQSSKLQELGNAVTRVEHEIEDISRQIDKLKLETNQ